MDNGTVNLRDALAEGYIALLRQPHDAFRIAHQSLYANTRDAIAELDGNSAEYTQDYFERFVFLLNDENSMQRFANVTDQYDNGKYDGYELRIRAELIHDEGSEHSPDWRHDNTIELYGDDATKFIAFLKTL